MENQNKFTDEISTKVFLYRTVKNKCLNHIKHQKVKNSFSNAYNENNIDENLFIKNYIKEETIRLVYQAIETLPEKSKNIIELNLKGLKNDEIADLLKISVNTVKTHKKSAYKTLRIKLKDILPSITFLLELLCE